MTNEQKPKNPLMSKDRLEMFSDGVFAIAITLLVLELKIPKHEELQQYGGLSHYLIHIWPSFLGYFVGFLVLGIYWSNHHHLFLFIVKKTDHNFNVINIFFLLTMALLPFSIAIVSDFATDPENINASVTLYSISLILPQIVLIILFHYGKRVPGIFDSNLKPDFVKKQITKLYFATCFSIVSIALSVFYPIIALIFLGLMFIIYFLPPDHAEYLQDASK